MEKCKRYLIFLIGLFINSFGVSFITKADLGTSPISSIPYVLSLHFPFTLGQFTIALSIVLILLQLMILRKHFKWEHLLQIPVSVVFGYFIDFTMILLKDMQPELYPVKLASLLIGCIILGLGVYLEVLADVVMLPGESFVRAIVFNWKTNFGNTKVVFDASMTLIAAVLSLIFFGKLNGIREGTIIAALFVGFIARLLGRWLAFLKPLLFPDKAKVSESPQTSFQVITIERQYGSGGHEIGKRLAQNLGYQFYDTELIQMISKTTSYPDDYIARNEEKMTNSFLYDLANQMYAYNLGEPAPKDAIFQAQSSAIVKAASEHNCVIVGRCADYVLKDHPNCFSVFLHAPLESRIRRTCKKEGLAYEKAKQKVLTEDKHRSDYYHYYTKRFWGLSPNYRLCADTDLGMEYTVHLIEESLTQFHS